MRLLLDTCAFIWCVNEPSRLGARSREALSDRDSLVHYSPISAAEIACLSDRKRIVLDRHWKIWFNHFAMMNGWTCMDITLDIMLEAYSLPDAFHPDPADRIIVATARRHDLVVVTGDRRILEYPHVATLA
jgi:PIN domain nuclease of toxin-antitoxin system